MRMMIMVMLMMMIMVMLMMMVMFVLMRRRCRTALTVDPSGVTTDVMLLLPDGYAMLYLIDDVPAREESLAAVPRADCHPHRHVTDREIANAMHAGGVLDSILGDGLGDDALTFLEGQRLEGLIFQMPYLLTFVMVAHQPFEGGVAAARRIGEVRAQRGCIDTFAAETKAAHGGVHGLSRRPRAG
jgi:hypothetical protein